MAGISWTKSYTSASDGDVLGGSDLQDIQDNIDSGVVLLTGTNTFTASNTFNRGLMINELGGNYDTRIEGDTDTHLFFVDASADRIGINKSTPGAKLEIVQDAAATAVAIDQDGAGNALVIDHDGASGTCLAIDNAGTGHSVQIVQVGNLATGKYALYINNSGTPVDGAKKAIRLDGCATTTDDNVGCTFTANRGCTGTQTDIVGWLEINIDATSRYIPYW